MLSVFSNHIGDAGCTVKNEWMEVGGNGEVNGRCQWYLFHTLAAADGLVFCSLSRKLSNGKTTVPKFQLKQHHHRVSEAECRLEITCYNSLIIHISREVLRKKGACPWLHQQMIWIRFRNWLHALCSPSPFLKRFWFFTVFRIKLPASKEHRGVISTQGVSRMELKLHPHLHWMVVWSQLSFKITVEFIPLIGYLFWLSMTGLFLSKCIP